MKSKFIFLLISIILLTSIFANNIQAYMPESHWSQVSAAILRSQNSPLGSIAATHPKLVMGGNLLSDLSVFQYFSSGTGKLGEAYKATHTSQFCQRISTLAETDEERACSIGACTHQFTDSRSHNYFVPSVIEKTYLVNGLVHIFAEEKVNDLILEKSPELNSYVRNALVYAAPICKPLFRRALINDAAFEGINFDGMYDDFVRFVGENDKYSVGFRGFTSVPFQIHLLLLTFGMLNIISFAFFTRKYMDKRKKKESFNIFNKISIFLNTFFIIFVIWAYVLFINGNIWQTFQSISTPVSNIMPVQGWEQPYQAAIDDVVTYFSQGTDFVLGVKDPSGEQALADAGRKGQPVRILVNVLFIGVIMLFIWLNFRKGRKK